jgi:hypothetical protein
MGYGAVYHINTWIFTAVKIPNHAFIKKLPKRFPQKKFRIYSLCRPSYLRDQPIVAFCDHYPDYIMTCTNHEILHHAVS